MTIASGSILPKHDGRHPSRHQRHEGGRNTVDKTVLSRAVGDELLEADLDDFERGLGLGHQRAVGEGRQWPVGLARKPKEAAAFYGVLALSAGIGIALNFTPINPISALYWSAVINGVLAVPVMVLLMFMARRRDVMGRFVVAGPLYWLGWLSTLAMLLSVVAMGVGFFV